MNKKLWIKCFVMGISIFLIGASFFTVESAKVMDCPSDETQNDYKNCDRDRTINSCYQNWLEQDKLTASDGSEFDWFGYSVSIDGEYAVIGAYQKDYGTGAAYVFKRSGDVWTQQQKLVASDGDTYDSFGISVSIDGDYIVVGAFSDDDVADNSGSAYVFIRTGSTWTEQQKLIASDGAADDRFGNSVSIDGEYIVVAASEDNTLKGSAYVFKRSGSTWIEQQKLTASDGESEDLFGCSVQLDGEYTIIGAYGDDDGGKFSGAAYVFKRTDSTWSQQQKLSASDSMENSGFGFSVSLYEDIALIGAIGDNFGTGSAYIFSRTGSTWSQDQKLVATDGDFGDVFGHSVSINENYAFVAAPQDDDKGDESGSVYVFQHSLNNWYDGQKLTASDGELEDLFGQSVSSDGNYVVIGAYGDDDNGDLSGSTYVFVNEVNSDLMCEGELDWNDVKVSSAVTGDFVIENIGDSGSELDWEISEYPDWGEWTFIPLNGDDLPPGEPFTVQVIVIAPDTPNKGFAGFIKIVNKENVNDICMIPVSLTTPKNKVIDFNYDLVIWLFNHFPNISPIFQYFLS